MAKTLFFFQSNPFPLLFFSLFFFLCFFFIFFVTWDGRFNKKRKQTKLYLIKNEENRTWDGVDSRL